MSSEVKCWHKNIDENGFCRDCGVRAAITLNVPASHPSAESAARSIVSALRDYYKGKPYLDPDPYILQELDRVLRALGGE